MGVCCDIVFLEKLTFGRIFREISREFLYVIAKFFTYVL